MSQETSTLSNDQKLQALESLLENILKSIDEKSEELTILDYSKQMCKAQIEQVQILITNETHNE